MALTDNLLAYWKLDGNSNDSVGSNNGTDTSISYSTSYGKIGQGANLNGSSSKIALPNDSNFKATTLTIAAWVKSTSNAYQVIFGNNFFNGSSWAGTQFSISHLSTGKLLAYITNGAGEETLVEGNTAVNDGNWHFVCLVLNGSSSKMYIDGSLDKDFSSTNPAYHSNNSPTIGARNVNGTYAQFFSGSLDEIGIWSRALSSSEISTLYNGGAGLQYPFETGSSKFFQVF